MWYNLAMARHENNTTMKATTQPCHQPSSPQRALDGLLFLADSSCCSVVLTCLTSCYFYVTLLYSVTWRMTQAHSNTYPRIRKNNLGPLVSITPPFHARRLRGASSTVSSSQCKVLWAKNSCKICRLPLKFHTREKCMKLQSAHSQCNHLEHLAVKSWSLRLPRPSRILICFLGIFLTPLWQRW